MNTVQPSNNHLGYSLRCTTPKPGKRPCIFTLEITTLLVLVTLDIATLFQALWSNWCIAATRGESEILSRFCLSKASQQFAELKIILYGVHLTHCLCRGIVITKRDPIFPPSVTGSGKVRQFHYFN